MESVVRMAPRRPYLPTLDPLIDRVARAPYWQRRLALSGKFSRFLYKYRALVPDDGASVDRLRDIIVRSRLWLSSPFDFNDPFDMAAKPVVEGSAAEIKQRYARVLREQSNWTRAERRTALKSLLRQSRNELLQQFEAAHEKSTRTTGVYAFAGDPRSILMWSHYADNHTGLCIQFEVVRDVATLIQALSVHYEKEYPVVNWVTPTVDRFRDSLLRKYDAWRYEGERRIIIPEGAHTFLPFRPEALIGIILGCRMPEAVHATVDQLLNERKALGHPAAQIYIAVKHKSKYALVMKRR